MSSTVCRICHSHAINPGHHGRPDYEAQVDHDLCDVCFWRTRFEAKCVVTDTLLDNLSYAVRRCPTKTTNYICHGESHFDTVIDYDSLRQSFKEILTATAED